jgi:hypothetical protein
MSETTTQTQTTAAAEQNGKRTPVDYGPVCESEEALKALPKPRKGEAYRVAFGGKVYLAYAG